MESSVARLRTLKVETTRTELYALLLEVQVLIDRNGAAIKKATTVDSMLCEQAILDEVARILREWTIPNETSLNISEIS